VTRWVELDQLQSPVAFVALELDARGAPDADAAHEAKADPCDLGSPVADVVARQAEPDWPLSQLALRELEQGTTVLVEMAVVGVVGVFGSGHDLGHEHLDAEGEGLFGRRPQVGAGLRDQDLLGQAEVACKDVRSDRLQRARKGEPIDSLLDVGEALERDRLRPVESELVRELVGTGLVEHVEDDAIVGLDGTVTERLELRTVAGDELETVVGAGQHHGCARPATRSQSRDRSWEIAPEPTLTKAVHRREYRMGSLS